jgi:hypothetical protein
MKYCGGTFSGLKLTVCASEIIVLGHRCTYEGRIPDETRVASIINWGPCRSLSEVRAFLGTVGLVRIFIRNFAHRAHHLVKLTRKGATFEFGADQIAAQEDLKEAVLSSPALRPIDYTSPSPVLLAVDTSYIAVGFHYCQCDLENLLNVTTTDSLQSPLTIAKHAFRNRSSKYTDSTALFDPFVFTSLAFATSSSKLMLDISKEC